MLSFENTTKSNNPVLLMAKYFLKWDAHWLNMYLHIDAEWPIYASVT